VKPVESRQGEYLISTDPARLDGAAVHVFLSKAYWCENIPRATLDRALANSLCFHLLHDKDGQVGLSRVVTDYATYAYLCDVYVLESHRGKGLARWMMEQVMAHPGLQDLRRFTLATRDAHGLYARFGFAAPKAPDRQMERHDPDVYRRLAALNGGD